MQPLRLKQFNTTKRFEWQYFFIDRFLMLILKSISIFFVSCCQIDLHEKRLANSTRSMIDPIGLAERNYDGRYVHWPIRSVAILVNYANRSGGSFCTLQFTNSWIYLREMGT